MEVVIGDLVSKVTDLKIGDEFYGTHGFDGNGHIHDNRSYEVVGIFEKSNSVIDNLIITDLKSVWQVHDHANDQECDHDHANDQECDHNESVSDELMITSMLVKFKSPIGIIQIPRKVNETSNLQAALPIFEISRLTNLLGFGVTTINLIALIIMFVSGLSIFISLFNSLKRRRYELALMRVHGATKRQLIKLVLLEGSLLSIAGTIFGLLISRSSLFLITILVNQNQKISNIEYTLLNSEIWLILIAFFIGFFASLIPSFLTYKINIPKILSNA
jgi:putative ABC transport system permease protein